LSQRTPDIGLWPLCPRERFIQELTSNAYDVVGISGIIVNIGKVREMCRLVPALAEINDRGRWTRIRDHTRNR
jgi:hypothetical protein